MAKLQLGIAAVAISLLTGLGMAAPTIDARGNATAKVDDGLRCGEFGHHVNQDEAYSMSEEIASKGFKVCCSHEDGTCVNAACRASFTTQYLFENETHEYPGASGCVDLCSATPGKQECEQCWIVGANVATMAGICSFVSGDAPVYCGGEWNYGQLGLIISM
ncbi:hypothetical protein K402DRAFT_468070 [Aulographum hederae CBS 113979]|uniref:Uncharacterized protein n=1 Tax=Aulographum hederae CBS 113979 TaxID=1176131 RepID=A0A6G1GII1_9PEZI|nr:hypothetical protein K402DRAFT_468070 [Aulographum hederae CBS 113979]